MYLQYKLAGSYYEMVNSIQQMVDTVTCDRFEGELTADEQRLCDLLDSDWAPVFGSAGAAGADLMTTETAFMQPGETKVLKTGICMRIPEMFEAQVRPRSGLWFKSQITCFQGTIDSDYRGEIMVSLTNHSHYARVIRVGDKIAQLVIAPYVKPEFQMVDSLEESERGENGFGSTDKKVG